MAMPENLCDAHLHYGNPAQLRPLAEHSSLRVQFPCYRTVEFDRMDSYTDRLAEHHVDRTVLIPFVFRELDKRQESLCVLEKAEEDPERYWPFALLDEDDPAFLEEHSNRLVGLKEHIVLHKTELTPKRKDILSSLQAHHMTFLIHTRSDLRYAYIRDIVHNFPSLKIQVAHMGRGRPGDVSFMIEMLEALAPFPHVSFDTSTVRQSQVVEAAVKIVGPERILYGSDFPFFMDELGIEDIMEQQIRHILKAGLPSAQQDLIFSENFKRLITRGI